MTDEEYQAGMARLLALMDMPLPDGSPEAEEFDLLRDEIAEYEQKELMRIIEELENDNQSI
jgi:antitoxin component HigA of HigAB toxin-antitoxin module